MDRIVIAITNEQLRTSVEQILSRNNILVRSSCRTGMEASRAIRKMDGGVLICSARLPDMTVDTLSYDLDRICYFLVLGRTETLGYLENEDLFKVALPVHSDELCGSVRILMQLDERRSREHISERTDEDKKAIDEAKAYLIEHNSMTEDQAHRFLQKRSMETSTPMSEVARLILFNAE
ncbi:MAG: ANTAR domain-containing protein [Lachnospiraceae bacterium]|jgi:hypothetical protein|nr:ANTAR domain-containing protein [Lachnospiraceae bacterium]